MKIVSYNVAGLRSIIKKSEFDCFINNEIYDIICLQETKAEENQVIIPDYIDFKYKYRFYNSTKGILKKRFIRSVNMVINRTY